MAARVQATLEAPLSATPSPTPAPLPRLVATSAPPTPTSTPAPALRAPTAIPTPTPTLVPTPTPAPTPTPEPAGGPTTYVLGDFVVEDGKFELRMGATAYWGYDAEQRIPTIPGLIEIVFGPIQVGETVSFARCRQSGSRSTKTHHLTVEKLGIDYNLDDGRFGADPPGGAVGDADDPNNNCEFTFDAPGEYLIDDSTDPGRHGVAKFVVEGEAIRAAEPVTYEINAFSIEDGKIELRMGSQPYWGYNAGQRISSSDGEGWVITVDVGDTLSMEVLAVSGSRSTKPHNFTIAGLGIDFEPEGREPYSITFATAGTFVVDDSTDPGEHGKAVIVVEGKATPTPAGEAVVSVDPTTRPAIQLAFRRWMPLEGRLIRLSEFVVEDGRFAFCCTGAGRSSIDPGGIVITANVGDTIRFSRVRLDASYSTRPHFFTVEGLDIDIPLAGRGSQPLEITFRKPGEFVIDDSSDPGAHGEAKFVVTGRPISLPINPSAIAVDDSGKVHVLDDLRVRVFNPEGGFLGDAVRGTSGSRSGEFRGPRGLAVDRTHIYVADTENHRVQVFSPTGTLLALWGSRGTEQGQFRSPEAIAVDRSHKVYVADTLNNRVQVFSFAGYFVASWGGRAGSRDGQFRRPQGIAVDQAGNIYVSDTLNDRVQVFSPSGVFSHKWGSQGRADGQFRNPRGIAVGSDGNVYVADTGNDRIQIFSPDGEFLGGWALPPGFGDGQFDGPTDIAVSKTGTVYVADSGNGRIQVFERAPDTGLAPAPKPAPPRLQAVFVTKWGRLPGIGDGRFNLPKGIAVGPLGDVYVADTGNERVQILDAAGGFQGILVEKLRFGPTDIGVDPLGNIYVADGPNRQSRVFNTRGEPLATWDDVTLPGGIAVDASGNVYVTDLSRHHVNKYGSDGESLARWGVEGNGEGQLQNPRGVAVDTEGNVYVADAGNHRVQVFTSTGEFLIQWGKRGTGEGRFDTPTGIAVDRSGRVYVVDTSNHRVQVFTGRGTFLGQWGRREGSGDGQLSEPSGIAIDDSGAVYVADTGNHRIQVFRIEIEGL